eukprot:14661215-Alexandrium_andersonii.AAC.1
MVSHCPAAYAVNEVWFRSEAGACLPEESPWAKARPDVLHARRGGGGGFDGLQIRHSVRGRRAKCGASGAQRCIPRSPTHWRALTLRFALPEARPSSALKRDVDEGVAD